MPLSFADFRHFRHAASRFRASPPLLRSRRRRAMFIHLRRFAATPSIRRRFLRLLFYAASAGFATFHCRFRHADISDATIFAIFTRHFRRYFSILILRHFLHNMPLTGRQRHTAIMLTRHSRAAISPCLHAVTPRTPHDAQHSHCQCQIGRLVSRQPSVTWPYLLLHVFAVLFASH